MDLLPRALLPGQLLLIAAGFVLLAFWPPVEGRLLLVPLQPAGQGALLAQAVGGGGRLIGQGPAGLLVIEGSRARIAAALATQRVLLIAAPHAACGDRA